MRPRKACRSHGAGLGHREVPIQMRAVDVTVMAGGGVEVGRAPTKWLCTLTIQETDTQYLFAVHSQCSGEACEKYAEDHGFKPRLQFF